MTDSCKTTVLAGVAGGYLLGRTKKAKLALSFAALVAGSRLAPKDLLSKGAEKITDTPQLAGVPDQVKDQVIAAARTAVTSLVERQVEALTGSLRERTERLGAPAAEPEAEDAEDAEDTEGAEGAEDAEDTGDAGDEEDGNGGDAAPPKRKAAARKKAAGTGKPDSARPRKKAASGGASGSRGTGKSSAKKTGKKPGKSTAKKSADRPRRR